MRYHARRMNEYRSRESPHFAGKIACKVEAQQRPSYSRISLDIGGMQVE